jgi:DNA-directed RNA polymerase delta subunit
MINVMQLIVKMPLLNITFPQNAVTFYKFINEISSFNLIPTEKLDSMIFNFTDPEMQDPNFLSMGMQKYNVVQNLGSTFYYLFCFLLLVVLVYILKAAKNKHKL